MKLKETNRISGVSTFEDKDGNTFFAFELPDKSVLGIDGEFIGIFDDEDEFKESLGEDEVPPD